MLPFTPDMWSTPTKPAPIALQLWTVRDQIEKDMITTLKRLKEIGYNHVETAFWPDHITLQQGATALKEAGLQVCSIHCEINDLNQWLELSEAYQCDTLIWHGWPEDSRYQSEQGIQQLADLYNQAFDFADKNGLKFGLHNHWWEFMNSHDQYPLAKLQPQLHPEIFFEIDTYWAKVAGQDPAEIVGKLGARAQYLHIKDGPTKYTEALNQDKPDPMVAVGQGTQDFPSIVEAANGNTQWMIVEMDLVETDVFEAIDSSLQYLINHNLGRTRL